MSILCIWQCRYLAKFQKHATRLCNNAQMDEWDDLRFVLAVARGGGLSGAARRLGVNHSTVSRRISGLEARLGVRLFDRLPSGHRPTEAGQDAIAAAERMEAAATEMAISLTGRDSALRGAVTLTAPLMILLGPFAEVLAAFRAAHPGIEVRLAATNDLLNLHRREADIAIRATDMPDDGLFGMRLTEQRAAIYAAPGYLDRQAQEGLPLDWIGNPRESAPPADVLGRFPGARIAARADDKLAALAAARAGIGACRLPCFQGDTDPALVRVPGFPLYRYPDKWILTHSDLRDVARVRAVMRFAADAVRARRALFMGERPIR